MKLLLNIESLIHYVEFSLQTVRFQYFSEIYDKNSTKVISDASSSVHVHTIQCQKMFKWFKALKNEVRFLHCFNESQIRHASQVNITHGLFFFYILFYALVFVLYMISNSTAVYNLKVKWKRKCACFVSC